MKRGYVLVIDQGTTGTTMLVMAENGEVKHRFYQAFAQSYPKPGWVEHDPGLIWQTVVCGLKEILSLSWINPEEIKAIGITNQRETTVIWDRRTGRPVYPAIVWQCRRTADKCQQLQEDGCQDLIRKKTGLIIDAYFSGSKIHWILENVPGVRERANRGELAFGTIDSWLIWNLTGGKSHVTDYSNASRTMLFNINNLEWDEELMQLLSIPPSLMPEVRPSAGLFGQTDPELTIKALPILGVLGDQQAALFGHGCLERGMMKNTYGTGCFLLMNTGEKPFITESGLLASVAWGLNGKVHYALEGSVFMGGAIIQWLRDELGLLRTASESEAMAMAVPDTNGVYFVPAFTGLGAPHWDPYARGSLQGLTRGANRNHIVRAALEGIAYQVGELIQSMAGATGTTLTELRVDGGAAANNFLLQFQANLSKLNILRNSSVELTGIGAAYITGLTAGLWSDLHALQALVSLERTFIPQNDEEAREKCWAGWRRAVERAKNWAVE